MRLAKKVLDSVKEAKVTVYYADRRITKNWNKERDRDEPLFYGGWYWQRSMGNRVIETDTDGPFRSESAALRDAWKKLQLR